METRTRHIVIDPTNMTTEESVILYNYLQAKTQFFQAGFKKHERDNYPNIPHSDSAIKTLELTHNLIARRCSAIPEENHYDVYAEIIGEGIFGLVAEQVGKLVTNDDHTMTFVPKNMQLGKFIYGLKYNIQLEYDLLKRLQWFHPKLTLISNNYDTYAVIVMRRAYGENLETILEMDQLNKFFSNIVLTTDQRLQASFLSLRRLQELYNYGIIHGDIKPSNIIIDLSVHPIRLSIIDLGLSADKKKTYVECGNTSI